MNNGRKVNQELARGRVRLITALVWDHNLMRKT